MGSESGSQGSEGDMQVQKCVLVLDAGNCTCSHWWSRHASRLGGPSGKLQGGRGHAESHRWHRQDTGHNGTERLATNLGMM